VEDIDSFLGSHPPFDGVGADELARVAAVTEIEAFPRGKTIFSEGTGPVEYLRVVRAGSVEVLHEGQVLDLLGPGELFGHASMLSGLPTGFEARAAEDTRCYRIPADVVGALLARPDFLRFIARSILSGRAAAGPERAPPVDPVQCRVAALIRTPPLLCPASEPIREAAKRMTAEGASAVLVQAGQMLGIVTDRDLRSRVVAAGASPDAPLAAIMTAPAYTVRGDVPGGDVLLDMLERGIHHVPVLSRFALQFRPPTGFLRDFVVEHSGERRGQLDIKRGGLTPIVDLARWAGMSAGAAGGSTVDRLRAAEAAGTLDSADARTLREAFGFIFSLRLDHQVEQLRRGEVPGDFIDPKTLNPLPRSYLKEAFRAVASVQTGLATELSLGIRWG